MDKHARRDSPKVLSVYVFIGLFSITFFLYTLYYLFGPNLPASENMLLTPIGNEPFSGLGFVFSIIPATIASLLYYASYRFQGVYERLVASILAVSAPVPLTTLFLPVGFVSGISMLLLLGVVATATLVRHPRTIQIPDLSDRSNVDPSGNVVLLAHNRLSLILRESVWVIVTLLVGGATTFFLYLSSIAGPIMSSVPLTRPYFLLQTVFFGGFLFYIGAGYLGSVTMTLYFRMVELENSYNGLVGCEWRRLGRVRKSRNMQMIPRTRATMPDAGLEGIDWGLIDKYFNAYGLYGKSQQYLKQSQEFIRRVRREGLQFVFYGIILGLYISIAAARLYDAVRSLGETALEMFWFLFTIVFFVSVLLFLRSITALTRQETFRNEKESNLAHKYFIEQNRRGFDEKMLWDELNRRKYRN
jgi:hypothetical protein